jgi:alpha-D-ribose 1-methylphosphonate 5-triphosphate synthase subunit PhnL
MMPTLLLEVRNLSKTFTLHTLNGKAIEALSDVNFTVKEGEIIGLKGKSGSGKSTLMKTIYRTYLVSTGEILYNSLNHGIVDLADLNEHIIIELRRKEITYCSQFLKVIPRVTAIDVVAESIIKKESDREFAREVAKDLLDRLGLPKELWDSFPSNFSGGEQQRINIAKAIIANPRFLLVDEPTASLDQKTKEVVIALIHEMKQHGTSVLCISHDNYVLDNLTDRNIYLQQGKILQEAYA